jgi:tubulin-folding cofactor B
MGFQEALLLWILPMDTSDTVTLFVESKNASSERRFSKSMTIAQVKQRLVAITGSQSIQLKLKVNETTIFLDDDDKMLGYYPVKDYSSLVVVDLNPSFDYNDTSKVQKMEMADDEYDQLPNSVRQFKKNMKLGRFSDNAKTWEEEARAIPLDSRCLVVNDELEKRGQVKYVGNLDKKFGYFIGVCLDEPLGKNNGSVNGKRYFECMNNHGVFVRPNSVIVGDYPMEDLLEEF